MTRLARSDARPWNVPGESDTATALESGHEFERLFAWRRVYEASAGANSWLTVHRWFYAESVARQTHADLSSKLELDPEHRLLDVGCASGATLAAIMPTGTRGFGLDHCEAVLRRARDFGVDRGQLQLGAADASRLPFGSASFDRVMCYSVFQCFPSTAYALRVIAEMLRVCKPNGLVLIGDVFGEMERPYRLLARAGLRGTTADALLSPLFPLRRIIARMSADIGRPQRLTYPRRFFRDAVLRLGGQVEFLEQDIPSRGLSQTRYDVRIRK